MLSLNDKEHLILLYNQFLKLNELVNKLALENDYESIENLLKDKDELISKIISFEKTRVEDIKNDEELISFKRKLIELEKKNIELIKTLKNDIIKDLVQVKTAKKVLNAYEPTTNQVVSPIVVDDELDE